MNFSQQLKKPFIKPVLLSVVACFLWGIIFFAPLFLENFCCIDIVLGRYFFYGILSLSFLIFFFIKNETDFLSYWKQALLCALVMNLGYFSALVLGIRLSDPFLITLIVGLAPMVITIVSCWKDQKEKLNFSLVFPALSIFLGLVMMNVQIIQTKWDQLSWLEYVEGIACGLISLAAWTWYVIFNNHLLKKNPDLNPHHWTILIGVMTLFIAIMGIGIRWFWIADEEMHLFSFEVEGKLFFAISLTLGVVCSWLAFTLWNLGSAHLPAKISGQLSILETLFGLLFIYSIKLQWPTILEVAGILCILAGISGSLILHYRESEPVQTTSDV
ncbi:MAG: DMT family transporter [Parachlamydiaceae bacterium]|nr:DMT family transporter [Parachlamydiaceae bacterium]